MKTRYIISAALAIYVLMLIRLTNADLEREKRFAMVDPNSDLGLSFLWQVPLSLILPTISTSKDYDYEYYDEPGYEGVEKDGRSFQNEDTPSFETSPNDLDVDLGYVRQTNKVQSLLTHLQIDSMACQERLICEMSMDTRKYSPLAELVLKNLKQNHGPVTQSSDNLIWRYMVAARNGISSSDSSLCSEFYQHCETPAYKMINMSVIKVWQYLDSIFHLKIM